MKELLESLDLDDDSCSNPEFRKQAYEICSCYLGGKWENLSEQHLEIKRIKGALSNVLFMCGLRDGFNNDTPNKVLLRFYYNPDKDNSITDTIVFALLSERKIGPKLYGLFNEGRIEEYIDSRPLMTHELADPKISIEIGRRLARIHKLKIPISKQPNYMHDAFERWQKQLIKHLGNDYKFKVLDRFRDVLPEEFSCDDLEKEVQYLRSFMENSNSPVVFSHNDLQEGNILLPNSAKNDPNGNDLGLVFIDFEYASYNYRGFDFANHFIEYTICYDIDETPYYKISKDKFPDERHMLMFMRSYLSEINPNVSQDDLERESRLLIKEALPFVPASHLFWSVWSFLQSITSPLSFGFAEYAQDRLYAYFKTKHLIDQIKESE